MKLVIDFLLMLSHKDIKRKIYNCKKANMDILYESGCTQRNFIDWLSSSGSLPTLIGLGSLHCLFQVNKTAMVFRVLNWSPIDLHHIFIEVIDFCVLSLITSRSSP